MTPPNREDSVLDEIDQLVNESLMRGDRSDSFHGEAYCSTQPCPWCEEGFHFLPITYNMRQMRQGSYATDEFGIGIVDPDYDYRTDDSPVICPGSEFYGPPHKDGWDRQSRVRSRVTSIPSYLEPGHRSGCTNRRLLRFRGPFPDWTVELNVIRVIDELHSVLSHQIIQATLTLNEPIVIPSVEWVAEYEQDIETYRFDGDGIARAEMLPITFRINSWACGLTQPNGYPAYVDIMTDYDVAGHHSWMAHLWEEIAQETNSDIVIIDEAYEFDTDTFQEGTRNAGRYPSSSQEAQG